MEAYFKGKPHPIFIYDDIREKGMPLITSGGKAPGATPLRECLIKIEEILATKKYGEHLGSLEVFDIMCLIARAVLSGGIRRAAMICLFDPDDEPMLTSKYGEWWIDNPHRALANISAVLDIREEESRVREKFFRIYRILQDSGSGEPGFYFAKDLDRLFNPCFEASLPPMGLCNLTSINVGDRPSSVELEQRAVAASFLGTLQAGFTDFFYLRKQWEEQAKKDPLLGVSLTGIASLEDPTVVDWELLGNKVVETNRKWAKKIGINVASRTTCVKPEGTSSLVMGTSSGVHAWYAPYYIRRMQLNKVEPLYLYLKETVPELIEDHYLHSELAVLSVPVKAPEGARMRSETAFQTLDRVLFFNKTWVQAGHTSGVTPHNVSCTVNVKPEEWKDLGEKIFSQRENLSGISMLPYDNGTYQQAPFEECSEEEFNRLSIFIKEVDLNKVMEQEDLTDLVGEVACGGGGCEVI